MERKPPVPESVLAQVRATVATQRQEDDAARATIADPLPGPSELAFTPTPDISVGGYTLRPMYDLDIELLAALKNPLATFMLAGFDGKATEAALAPRGPAAWQAVWLLTRPLAVAKQAFKEHGAAWVAEQAETEFGAMQFPALLALGGAALEQASRYWGPLQTTTGKEAGGVPPHSTEPPWMGTAGSSKSGAHS